MELVLDASVTIAWLMPDEQTAPSQEVLDRVTSSGAYVPGIWRLEVGNTLLLAEMRGRILQDHRKRAIEQLLALPILVDMETDAHAWRATYTLAQQFGLTLYDASYLELARRRGLPLATLDRDLRRGAQTIGTSLLGM